MEYIRATGSFISRILNQAMDGLEVIGEASIKGEQNGLLQIIAEDLCSDTMIRLVEGPTNPTGFYDAMVLSRAKNLALDTKSRLKKLKTLGMSEDDIEVRITDNVSKIRDISPEDARLFILNRFEKFKTKSTK